MLALAYPDHTRDAQSAKVSIRRFSFRKVSNMSACGIYEIVNIKTNLCYIGQSIDLNTRKSKHYSMLRRNCHPKRTKPFTPRVQGDW